MSKDEMIEKIDLQENALQAKDKEIEKLKCLIDEQENTLDGLKLMLDRMKRMAESVYTIECIANDCNELLDDIAKKLEV